MIEQFNKYQDSIGRLFIVIDIRHDYNEKGRILFPVRYELLDVAKESTVFVTVKEMEDYISKKIFIKINKK